MSASRTTQTKSVPVPPAGTVALDGVGPLTIWYAPPLTVSVGTTPDTVEPLLAFNVTVTTSLTGTNVRLTVSDVSRPPEEPATPGTGVYVPYVEPALALPVTYVDPAGIASTIRTLTSGSEPGEYGDRV